MIALKDNRISMYEGDYRPVETMRNGQKLAGWKRVGMTGSEGEFTGTYNDALTVYGKSGYRESRNLCPPPEAKTMNGGIIEVVLEPTANGRFDLSSRTVSNDVAMMMSPNIIHSVTLSAGIYAASSNSAVLGLSMGDEMVYSLPHTFTLETDQTIYFGTYSTDFAETDLYLQIESGESVTDYDPYAGDPTKEPSPDNIKELVGAKAVLTISGSNLLDLKSMESAVFYPLEDGSYMFLKTEYNRFTSRLTLNIPKGVKYTFSIPIVESNIEGSSRFIIRFFYEDGTNSTIPVDGYTRIAEKGIVAMDWFIGNEQADGAYVRIKQPQLNLQGVFPYQMFHEPYTITLPALHGVTEDGENNYYIADTINGGMLQRKIKERVFDGTEAWYKYQSDTIQGFALALYQPAIANNEVGCCCNAFIGRSWNSILQGGKGIAICDGSMIIINQHCDLFEDDIEKWKNFLSAQYAKGNPVQLIYALQVPEITHFNSIEQPRTLERYTNISLMPDQGYLIPEVTIRCEDNTEETSS